jgi:hypothetical protein
MNKWCSRHLTKFKFRIKTSFFFFFLLDAVAHSEQMTEIGRGDDLRSLYFTLRQYI